jgi:arylsulfatase A-like enzyme
MLARSRRSTRRWSSGRGPTEHRNGTGTLVTDALRDQRFKLINQTNRGTVSVELYDLTVDPFELSDLLQSPDGLSADAEAAFLALDAERASILASFPTP